MDWQRGKIPFFVPPPDSDEFKLAKEREEEERKANEEQTENDKVINYAYFQFKIEQNIGEITMTNQFDEEDTAK